jgi:ABC-type phosphate transport system auxiliary subunit
MGILIAAAVSITALTALFVLAVLTVRPFLPAEVVRRSRREGEAESRSTSPGSTSRTS